MLVTASGVQALLFETVSELAPFSISFERVSINYKTTWLTLLSFNPNTGVQCPTLVAPSNGRLKIAGPGGYEVVACDTGFNLVGTPQHVCQSDGTWSGSEPTCKSK